MHISYMSVMVYHVSDLFSDDSRINLFAQYSYNFFVYLRLFKNIKVAPLFLAKQLIALLLYSLLILSWAKGIWKKADVGCKVKEKNIYGECYAIDSYPAWELSPKIDYFPFKLHSFLILAPINPHHFNYWPWTWFLTFYSQCLAPGRPNKHLKN